MRECLSAPLIVDFNVTKRCNLKCMFCYASAGEGEKNEMSLAEIDKIFNELNDLNVHIVRISGGEPFVRSDIRDIIKLTEKYNFTVCMNTNGTLLSDEDIELISKSKIVSVGISLDGYNALLHDKIRGVPGSFDKTLDVLKKMNSKIGLKLSTTYTITSQNCSIEQIRNALDLNLKLGIKKVSFQLTSPVGRCTEELSYTPTYTQWKEVFLWLTKYKKQNSELDIDVHPTNESDVYWEFYLPLKESGQLELLREVWGQDENSVGSEYVSCVAGYTTAAIASNGDVYPCELMMSYPELSVGNVVKEPFKNIWNNSKVLKELNSITTKSIQGECKNCDLSFCGGGCRAVSYALHNRLDSADNRCPLTVKDVSRC